MRVGQLMAVALVPGLLVPHPAAGIVAFPPERVGPPGVYPEDTCGVRFEAPGGVTGVPIPVSALRLRAVLTRGKVSFETVVSGTAALMEVERRRRAGLPFAPKVFNVDGADRPEVFSIGGVEAARRPVYQRLPLRSTSTAYRSDALVFSQAASATAGRIVSLQLTMSAAPRPKPKLRVVPKPQAEALRCMDFDPLDVFAPAMTVAQVRRLFKRSDCSWYRLDGCARAAWPRGPVVFVQRSGEGYVHRWVDYDRLAAMRFGMTPST